MNYCTTVLGPRILSNVIVSGYVIFYQINTFFCKYTVFSLLTNVFCGQMKRLRGSDLARVP